jgi:beta-lactamase class D
VPATRLLAIRLPGTRLIAIALSAASLAMFTSCGLFGGDPKPADTARAFVQAIASGDSASASRLTDQPTAAAALLDKIRGGLKPTAVRADVDQVRDSGADTASASFTVTWVVGEGREWTYPSTFDLRRTGDKAKLWTVHWSPTVLHPKLSAQQTVAVREEQSQPAPIVDRDGGPLLAPQKVVVVLLYREPAGDIPAVAAALSGALRQFDAGITTESIVDGATKTADGNGYPVAVLREPDYQSVKDQIYDLPGVRFSAQTRMLAADREFARQVLPTIRTAVEAQITGKPGWRVVTLDTAGAEVDTVHETPPTPGTTVTTTLSRPVQTAAEGAVEGVQQQAMIVALQPSTGEVLAVAQNAAADAAGPIALSGRYPPGSTFKTVTATAALQAGAVTADSPVPCPGSTVIDGRAIPNNDGFDLGTVPLHTAFARSCNTTFARLAADLPAQALPDAARQLGLGLDFVMAGATTVTGSVPPGDSTVARAEAGFGQGAVVASPFGMALVAATVAHGSMPTPVLIRGTATTADATPAAVAPNVIDPLRAMMREVVTAGTARALAGSGEVYGKTGTAQFGDGTRSHGWFVGYRGDLAFAVLVVDAGSSAPAVQTAARLLAAIP